MNKDNSDNTIINLNIREVISKRNSRLLKMLPSFAIKMLENLIHQKEINHILKKYKNLSGLDFVNASLDHLNIKINIVGYENISKTGNYIFAANHPLGGLDGLALMSAIGRYREDVRFIVNDLLLTLKNFDPLFVPVNNFGKNKYENLTKVNEAYESDSQILIFPAGLVSRRKNFKISDVPWRKNFIVNAKKHKRDVIPVHIDSRNSNLFYNIARFRSFLGIKANIEMLFLADELFKKKNHTITIRIGEPIPYEMFDRSNSYNGWANEVKDHVYSLKSGKSSILSTRKLKLSKEIFSKIYFRKSRLQFKPLGIPIPKDVLESELTEDKYLRPTNNGSNKIYVVTQHDSPNIMLEVGRLRELTFRKAGGGTGKRFDIDDYDTNDTPYKQLIVWDPEQKEIIGGYRYILCRDAGFRENGDVRLATTGLFKLSNHFKDNYLPYMIELGRSFIQPNYQSTKSSRKSIFALDNLWDGLGALTVKHPDMKYFYGKVTMYQHYNAKARDMILAFMKYHFPDPDNLIVPLRPLLIHGDEEEILKMFDSDNYSENYKTLVKNVRELKENVPPLINSYMSLSPTMKSFGTALNTAFGDVEETGIMVTIPDIYEKKKARHIESYLKFLAENPNKK